MQPNPKKARATCRRGARELKKAAPTEPQEAQGSSGTSAGGAMVKEEKEEELDTTSLVMVCEISDDDSQPPGRPF